MLFQGELTGLCGNFDLKTINELRTPDNFELTNSQEFGNSWTAVEVLGKIMYLIVDLYMLLLHHPVYLE